jgi:hypothetical protein
VNNHIGGTNKMVSDTPRTDAAYFKPHATMYDLAGEMKLMERELNRACEMYRKLDIHTLDLVDRIIRLEKAGDAMERLLPDGTICDKVANLWLKAKEAKL